MSAQSLKPGWHMVTFGDVVENVAIRVSPSEATADIYVGLEHLDPTTIHLRRWGKPSDVSGDKLVFKKGDVIFGRRRAYQRKLAVAEFDGICSAHAMVLRAKPQMMVPEFMPFFLQSNTFMDRAIEISVGSLSPTINWKSLRIQEFPLPPIWEQRRIAEILWATESVVERYIALHKGTAKYIKTFIEKELTPKQNSKRVLGDYCPTNGIKIGPFGSLLHAQDYQSNGVPVVMPTDIEDGLIKEDRVSRISNKKADELAGHKLRENDILFPRRGDLTKRAIVLSDQEGWLCGTGSIRVRLNEGVNPRLVFYALTCISTNRWLEKFSVGTTMPNLNASTISRIPVNLPEGDSGDNLVNIIEKLMCLSKRVEEHSNTLLTLRKNLLNKLLADEPNECVLVTNNAHRF